MASQQQPARGSQRTSSKQKPAAQASAPRSQAQSGETQTSDHVYGVVSVLYHALQGAQTYGQYIQDARQGGDEELLSFFVQCQKEEQRRAKRAKALLAARLPDEDDEDEDEDDDEDDEDEDDEDEDEDDEDA